MRFYNPSVLRACYKPCHYLAFTALFFFSVQSRPLWTLASVPVCLVCLVCLLPRLLPLSHSEDFLSGSQESDWNPGDSSWHCHHLSKAVALGTAADLIQSF